MNKVKRFACGLCALVMLGGMTFSARAETVFDGKVTAGETTTVFAPYGGTLKSIDLREGQWIDEGEVVATIETTRIFATENGTVRGVYAEPGDSIASTVLNIAPVNKYTISANIEKAYSSAATKYVSIGEKVHIACSKDGTHKAVGIITAVKGSEFTVETTGGELYLEETVYIYRSPSYTTKSRVGSGTVARTGEIAVSGTGSLLRIYVEDGDEVERGQLLFETVEGSIDALTVSDGEIISPTSGVIASINVKVGGKVQKGGALLTIYPRETYQVEMSVPEDMLSSIAEGDEVSIYFDWNADSALMYTGTIQSISFMKLSDADDSSSDNASPDNTSPDATMGNDGNANADSGGSTDTDYKAYVTFVADENVRIGMTATIILS